MKPIAIIPARGGSKRIPRKNIVDLNGHPIISYAIKTCQESGIFSKIFVSTEDNEIADIAHNYGVEIDKRPEELASDRAPIIKVLKELLSRKFEETSRPQHFCCVYAIAAFIMVEDLVESEKKLKDSDAVMGVSGYPIHPYKAMVEKDGSMHPLFPEENLKQSQFFPETFASNGTFAWLKTDLFLKEPTFYPPRLSGYVVPTERALDIDTPEDLKNARQLMRLKSIENS